MAKVKPSIYFDRTHFDDVVLAVIAVDAFNGQVIAKGIEAHIEKQIGGSFKQFPIKPIRNASGMLVFINRKNQAPLESPPTLPAPPYRIVVDALEADYFDPPSTMITALPNDKKLVLRLHRRPSVALDSATTSVSGVIVRGVAQVADVVIKSIYPAAILPPNAQPEPFETRSDERGAFSLRMRLPATSATVRFEIGDIGTPRIFDRNIAEGKAYAFDTPIDLQGTNSNNNPLIVALVP